MAPFGIYILDFLRLWRHQERVGPAETRHTMRLL